LFKKLNVIYNYCKTLAKCENELWLPGDRQRKEPCTPLSVISRSGCRSLQPLIWIQLK